ncbi:hypothetical protein B7463_g7469, partial [Scytalidium lignicola]
MEKSRKSTPHHASSANAEKQAFKADTYGLDMLVAAALGQDPPVEKSFEASKKSPASTITEEDIKEGMGGVPMVRTSNVLLPFADRPLLFVPYKEKGTQVHSQKQIGNHNEIPRSGLANIAQAAEEEPPFRMRNTEEGSLRQEHLGAMDYSNPALSTAQQSRVPKRRHAAIDSHPTSNDQNGFTVGHGSDNSQTMHDDSPTDQNSLRKRRKVEIPAINAQGTKPDKEVEAVMDPMKRKMDHEIRQREYNAAIAAKRRKGDDDVYTGLKNFKGPQRGWNGEHPAIFRQTLYAREDLRRRQLQGQLARKKAAEEQDARKKNGAANNSLLQLPTRTDREYEEWFGQAMSLREINRIQTMDAVQQVEEDAHRFMMSRPFDHHQIGLQARREKKAADSARNSKESSRRVK